jgi:hypothetical protein
VGKNAYSRLRLIKNGKIEHGKGAEERVNFIFVPSSRKKAKPGSFG